MFSIDIEKSSSDSPRTRKFCFHFDRSPDLIFSNKMIAGGVRRNSMTFVSTAEPQRCSATRKTNWRTSDEWDAIKKSCVD